jgi:single-strand DNA-binding protein
MYQNKVILMGFLGKDAEVRTGNNNRNFTTLSIATKSSYKDKESGEYISRTEWHNCIAFGKLAEFAGTLKKGAHIQVEGELRHTEYESRKTGTKQQSTQVRVTSILKLDRVEKSAPEDEEHDDNATEETAA